MVIDGKYDIEVSMPQGKRTLHIILKSQDKTVTGSIDGPFGKHSFSEGSVNNNEVAWRVILKHQAEETEPGSVERQKGGFFRKIGRFIGDALSGPPIGTLPERENKTSMTELPVEFTATITGEEIRGKMKFGTYAAGEFKGIRTGK